MRTVHFIVLLACLSISFAFDLDSFAEEDDARAALGRELEDGWDFDTAQSDVQTAIYRGWWRLAQELIEAAKTNNVDLTNKVYQAQSLLRRKMTELTDALQKRRGPSRYVSSPVSAVMKAFSHC